MPKKRIISIKNWEKWQARSDKELPWLKLWGRLFKAPWFQELDVEERFVTICILDMARQFNNKLDEESIFNGYLSRNYHVFISKERIFKLCKSLSDNEFLSDNVVGLEGDKIRVDKIKNPPASPDSFKNDASDPRKVDLKDIPIQLSESSKHRIYNSVLPLFQSRGWRTDPEFVKPIFKNLVFDMVRYNPKDPFPYLKKCWNNFININAEWLSAQSKKQIQSNPRLEALTEQILEGKTAR